MTTSYPEQILALLTPPIIITYDERDDILHTPEWPVCKDASCPCQEPGAEALACPTFEGVPHAPFEQCSCSSCEFVRQGERAARVLGRECPHQSELVARYF